MKILVVNDRGSHGGASIAANRICRALMARGHIIAQICASWARIDETACHVSCANGISYESRDSMATLVRKRLARRKAKYDNLALLKKAIADFQPDLIHVHNLHGFHGGELELLKTCIDSAPVVWTLHDMWALTGGKPHVPDEELSQAPEAIYSLYQTGRLTFVAPSKWLTQKAASLFQMALQISNPLSHCTFNILDKQPCRRILNIRSNEQPCLITSAVNADDPLKGFHILVKALNESGNHFHILRLGIRKPGVENPQLPTNIPVTSLGALNGDARLALAYNCADLLVHPSLADNQPLVIMEAMACGVPVVALPVGGVPEMIEDGVTGWLAEDTTPGGLARALQRALNQRNEWAEFGRRARAGVERDYNPPTIAARYESIYCALVDNEPIPSQMKLDQLR